jgi:hypothetical protein
MATVERASRVGSRSTTTVITKLEPKLFLAVTALTVKDFHLLLS